MKILILLIFFLLPLFTFADTYESAAGAAKSFGDYITDFWDFFDNDVPSFFDRALAFIVEKVTLIRITMEIQTMKLAWTTAKAIMENFQIASKLASAISVLPQDVKGALVDLRILDGVNIVLQAYVARYVLRFL